MTRRHSCGWVVRHSMTTRSGRIVDSWWLGPERSWGTSFGPLLDGNTGTLSMSVAVFSTRRDARLAMASVGLRGCTPVPLNLAVDEIEWRAA